MTSTFIVVPEGGQGTEQISVLMLQAAPSILYDRDATSELRVVNGATDQAPRDVAVDSQFSPPLFSAIPFGEPTPYAPYPTVAAKINVTPVGNPGVLELDQTLAGVPGQRATMLFAGPAGTLFGTFALDDGRRINLEAKVRFMTAVSQFFAVDFVVTLPDGDPNFLRRRGNVDCSGSLLLLHAARSRRVRPLCLPGRHSERCCRDRRASAWRPAASTACSR